MRSRVWAGWLRVTEVLGTIQMIVLLSVVYWLMISFVSIPLRLFEDPLTLRRPRSGNWRNLEGTAAEPTELRRQG